MKKILFSALLAMGVVLTLASCDNKKAKISAETEETASQVTDQIKEEAMALFRDIQSERVTMMREIVVTRDEVKMLPVKFFLPLELADKAQTNYQRAQLLGIYMADKQCDETTFSSHNEAKERDAVIAKLAAEANLQLSSMEEMEQMNEEEKQSALNDVTLNSIESNLENGNADAALVAASYSVVEATLCKIGVAELMEEYDQQEIFKSLLMHKDMLANTVKLHTLLLPYYESLSEMNELVERINGVVEAADEASTDVALLQYINYCKETRGKIAAY